MSRDVDKTLLSEQLGLLEEKKREFPEILRCGRPGQDIADELAGIRMVILAALLHSGEGSEAEHGDLRLREQEARALLREVMLPPFERRRPGRAGDLLAGELVASL
ncbi:MAG: hypothetical protein M3R38_26810 [Actinomycetota bacterium]|nr:hypothetical protein [Actinomycetota bacterium]